MANKRFYDYILLPVVIGILTGIFAIAFLYSVDFITHIVLEKIVGYIQPLLAGEGEREYFTFHPLRPFLLPLTVALGGLISGLLTYFLAPESAGVGTDVAIRAYHRGEKLSILSSMVKLISSAIIIGTGGTSGREGPIALIGAGIGSSIADVFKLSNSERRTALAVGLGAGIAAVFRAPLAGALISAEVFFKRDFDIEAMIPSFIASVIAYSFIGFTFGFHPIFSVDILPFNFNNLIVYVGLGIISAIAVRLFIKTYFTIQGKFEKAKLPPYTKPAVGGFITGLIGAFIPMSIGNGYGWLQLIMDGKLMNLYLILLGFVAVCLGASFTLGSGGSGGLFGPSVMMGGFIGAFYAIVLNNMFHLSLHLASFTIVGMVAFFAGAAKAPLSTLILVAEMTGGYDLLVPAMIAVFTSYFMSGMESIFVNQVPTRLDSPTHLEDWGIYILEKLKVKDYMKKPISIGPDRPVEEAQRIMIEKGISGIPVLKGTKLVGIVTKSDILSLKNKEGKKVQDIMTLEPITATPDMSLAQALSLMWEKGIGRLPVVEKEGSKNIVGIIARADISKAIREWRKNGT